MDIFFILLSFLAIFHLMYEGVIAPELRMEVRNELFALRDKLRDIKCREKDLIADEAFDIVHDALNRFTHRVKDFTIFVLAQMKRLRETNPEACKRIAARHQQLKSVPSEEFRALLKEIDRVLVKAILINSGAWFVFIIPIALLVSFFTKLSKMAMAVLVLPGNLFDGMAAEQNRKVAF